MHRLEGPGHWQVLEQGQRHQQEQFEDLGPPHQGSNLVLRMVLEPALKWVSSQSQVIMSHLDLELVLKHPQLDLLAYTILVAFHDFRH